MRPTHIPAFDANVGQASSWYDDARKEAMARVENTRKAKQGMEGKLNTTERSQRYERPASRSAVPNGVFEGSPMEYLTSAGLRGGVITTKEGQEWLATRLKQRKEEFGAIRTGNFSRGPPSRIPVSSTTMVDTLLQQIFASFGAGSFTPGTASALSQLLTEMLKIGATITPSQLTTYSRAIQKLNETIRGYRGRETGVEFEREGLIAEAVRDIDPERDPVARAFLAANPAEERLRAVESMQTTLKQINGVIREIARTIYDPQNAREQVMATLQQRLLGEQISNYDPTFAEPGRQAAVRAVPEEIPLGGPAQGPTLTGPTFAEIEAARRAEARRAEAEARAAADRAAADRAVDEDLAERMEGLGKRRGRPRKHKF